VNLSNDTAADIGLLLARLMLSLVFLWSGIDKAVHWSEGLGEIVSAGLPYPSLLLAATVLVQLGGGLSVALGIFVRLGAMALAGFTVVATMLFHDFWALRSRRAPASTHHLPRAHSHPRRLHRRDLPGCGTTSRASAQQKVTHAVDGEIRPASTVSVEEHRAIWTATASRLFERYVLGGRRALATWIRSLDDAARTLGSRGRRSRL